MIHGEIKLVTFSMESDALESDALERDEGISLNEWTSSSLILSKKKKSFKVTLSLYSPVY